MSTGLTYLLADDDELYRDYTLLQLQRIPGIKCLMECDNAFEVREQLPLLQPDFLILDVEMPGLSGMQLVKSLKKQPLVVFITSHPQFAVDAFELDAVDYMVKPVAPERMLRAVDKVKMLAALQNDHPDEPSFKQEDEHFFIKDKGLFSRFAYADVLYIESLGNFVNFHLKNNEKKIALVSLSQLEAQLSSKKFIRIGRAHIINKQHITAIESEMVHIDNIQLPVGRMYADAVMNDILGSHVIRRHTK